MDTMPGNQPMHNPPPLGGLDPADLLEQGFADDTFEDDEPLSFNLPPIGELAAIFPQFEILELIGKGGMGAVYKVRQKDLDRVVALKILPPAIGRSPEFSSRFTREARALAKLNHPGIVTLYEFGQQDGLYFILMEFVDGVNLAQLMKTGRISPREALAIVPQICDALQFAHDQGIVHRDIKPENILLDRLGRVKVADFGIAKVVAGACDRRTEDELPQPTAPADATLAGKIIGTPAYMAPEQISHPADVDHRADIYALGVVFYQMLTGELPGKDLQAPLRKVHLDIRLDEIVLRAMEKDPKLRFQQASVMRTRVDDLGANPIKPPNDKRNTHIDSFAIVSLILAIASFGMGPFGSLPAVIFGHISISKIKNNSLLTGQGFARSGLVLGYLNLVLCVLLALSLYLPPVGWASKNPVVQRQVILPPKSQPDQPEAQPETVIDFSVDGKPRIDGKIRGDDEFLVKLKSIATQFPNRLVVIRGTEQTKYENVVRVLDMCSMAGISNLSFATGQARADAQTQYQHHRATEHQLSPQLNPPHTELEIAALSATLTRSVHAETAKRLGDPEVALLAEIWIVSIDAGKYSRSWKDAAGFFRSAITEHGWVSTLEEMRKPLGAVKSRAIRDLRRANAPPGAPDGEYLAIQFDTSFAAKAAAVETVTFMLEKDGTWKVAAYSIQ